MKAGRILLLLMIMGLSMGLRAQFDPEKICRLDEGKLIFTLDKNWTKAQKLEVAQLFDLDSTLVLNVYDGKKEITARSVKWEIRQLGGGKVELIKQMGMAKTPTGTGNVIILDDRWINAEGINERESATFGVNKFTLYTVFNYHGGTAKFFLPKHLQARQVFLSGTFNNWGTMDTPMEKTDSGWIVSVKMAPGKYLYKFIVDGRWIHDPFNFQKEDDQNGGFNSIVYCYNYRFFLKGFPGAKKIFIAGSFNNWNPEELSLHKVRNGWALYLYLREGTHAYKYIVDNNWILDPYNPVVRKDGAGNENSFMSIGDTIYFRLKGYQDKKDVYLSGNFNAWNTAELKMNKIPGGWELPYVLAAGNYEYKFIIDGNWIPDPENPFKVYSGSIVNSQKVIRPNWLFTLSDYPDAKKVIVTGSFSGWSTENYVMVKQGDRWILPMYLKPGKYTYKFIVDGNWHEDPANDKWETNQYGSKNSVLWIEP
jgi:hypothetical protein